MTEDSHSPHDDVASRIVSARRLQAQQPFDRQAVDDLSRRLNAEWRRVTDVSATVDLVELPAVRGWGREPPPRSILTRNVRKRGLPARWIVIGLAILLLLAAALAAFDPSAFKLLRYAPAGLQELLPKVLRHL